MKPLNNWFKNEKTKFFKLKKKNNNHNLKFTKTNKNQQKNYSHLKLIIKQKYFINMLQNW